MKNKILLFFGCLFITYLLCLLPSSFFRNLFCNSILCSTGCSFWDFFCAHTLLVESIAHATLMAGIAYFLFLVLKIKYNKRLAFLVTLAMVALIAISVEYFQSLLPETFSRGAAWNDVWASLAGGLLGMVVSLRN